MIKNKFSFNMNIMLKSAFFLLITFNFQLLTFYCSAQGIAININGNDANNSAMLDIDVTGMNPKAGMLTPRMTTDERNLITSPASGLIIYNTDCRNFNYYDGNSWVPWNTNNAYIPTQPGVITGSTSVCANASGVTYSIAAVSGAVSYLWTVPAGSVITSGQGTTSTTVTFGNISGNISVTQSNACGTSSPSALAITVNNAPATPGPITGPITAVPGQAGGAVSYSISPVANASTYNWTYPTGVTLYSGEGTSTIALTYTCNALSGIISVTSQSTCGTSEPRNLTITIGSLLSVTTSGVISGATISSPTVTGGQTPYNSYSWSPVSGLSNYSIANPIVLCSGSPTSYIVTVTDANSCTATSSVSVTRNLTANAGPNLSAACPVTLGSSPTASGGTPTYSYAWNPSVSSNIANPTATPSGTPTSYYVTITDINGCTATSSMTLTQQSLSNQQTFSYTAPGGEQSFTVPAGITCIKIEAWGAQGGIGYSSGYAAGLGGYVAGNTTVAPNDVLKVYVGGKGADATTLGGGIGGYNGGGTGAYNNSNYNGGGGGGASDVRYGGTTLSYRIIVGGAGGGSSGYSSSGGTGGAGGSTASGALGIGGNSSACGGAGGGGYNGGVGGTSCGSSGGGGGGGSSWAGTLTSTTLTSGIRSGNGQIIIHW